MERRRADEAAARKAVADDPAVLYVDPGLQVVGLSEAIVVTQPVRDRPLRVGRAEAASYFPIPSSNGSFGIPSIASDGIHDIAVTEDSTRITRSLVARSTLEHRGAFVSFGYLP